MADVLDFTKHRGEGNWGEHLRFHVDIKTHVPEGDYIVVTDRIHQTPFYKPREKRWFLGMDCAVISGDHSGSIITKYFRIKSFDRATRKIIWAGNSDFMKLLRSVGGGAVRCDRASPVRLKNVPLTATVQDVKKRADSSPLPDAEIYSKITKLRIVDK